MSCRSAAAACLLGLVAELLLGGCATRIRNVPHQPLVKQSSAVVERDRRECEAAITGKLKGVWFPAEVEFASCLLARNYQVYIQLLDASVEVRKTSLRTRIPPQRVMSDLVACERSVSMNVTWAEWIGRPAISVAGFFFWPASVGGLAATIFLPESRERDYADCMRPLGYTVIRWEPGPGDATFSAVGEDRASP